VHLTIDDDDDGANELRGLVAAVALACVAALAGVVAGLGVFVLEVGVVQEATDIDAIPCSANAARNQTHCINTRNR
jgi:hypothetical protein